MVQMLASKPRVKAGHRILYPSMQRSEGSGGDRWDVASPIEFIEKIVSIASEASPELCDQLPEPLLDDGYAESLVKAYTKLELKDSRLKPWGWLPLNKELQRLDMLTKQFESIVRAEPLRHSWACPSYNRAQLAFTSAVLDDRAGKRESDLAIAKATAEVGFLLSRLTAVKEPNERLLFPLAQPVNNVEQSLERLIPSIKAAYEAKRPASMLMEDSIRIFHGVELRPVSTTWDALVISCNLFPAQRSGEEDERKETTLPGPNEEESDVGASTTKAKRAAVSPECDQIEEANTVEVV